MEIKSTQTTFFVFLRPTSMQMLKQFDQKLKAF